MTIQLLLGDCLEILPTLEENSVDTIITDPPAGISFMGKKWDSDKGGVEQWIAWLSSVLAECRRVLKPGGSLLCWAIPRTSHWTGMAIERAGYRIIDIVVHCHGQGFPKSLDISKGMDQMAGVERKVIGTRAGAGSKRFCGETEGKRFGPIVHDTAPATDEAKLWHGYGTGLAPACEFWWLAYNPREGTYCQNALRYGVSGLNIDGARIPTNWDTDPTRRGWQGGNSRPGYKSNVPIVPGDGKERVSFPNESGRFPSDLILQHHPECVKVGTRQVKTGMGWTNVKDKHRQRGFNTSPQDGGHSYGDDDGLETIEDWDCHPSCPVRVIGEQSGERTSGGKVRHGNVSIFGGKDTRKIRSPVEASTGTAARYFLNLLPDEPLIRYQAKPSNREKNKGLDRDAQKVNDGRKTPIDNPYQRGETLRQNTHPTTKSLELMRYFVKLTKTPTGGVVLDPFMGSGTTGVACVAEGRDFIGIEMNEEYFEIAKARIEHEQSKPRQLELL